MSGEQKVPLFVGIFMIFCASLGQFVLSPEEGWTGAIGDSLHSVGFIFGGILLLRYAYTKAQYESSKEKE